MTTKYYVDSNGNYLGGYSQGNSAIPQDAIEVPNPPSNVSYQIWDSNQVSWVNNESSYVEFLKTQLITARQKYLKDTDWYIQREADQPNTYPENIKLQRIAARREINEIENCTTSEQLNQFN